MATNTYDDDPDEMPDAGDDPVETPIPKGLASFFDTADDSAENKLRLEDADEADLLENMPQGDPRLDLILAVPPSQQPEHLLLRWDDVPVDDQISNKYGVKVVQKHKRKYNEIRDHRIFPKWYGTKWLMFECRCGKRWEKMADPEKVQRCGCQVIPAPKYNLLNATFSKLTVTGYNYTTGMWVCSCACGGTTEAMTSKLRGGMIRNCGPDCAARMQGVGKPLLTARGGQQAAEAYGLNVTGYKMFNMQARHHAFVAYLRQELGQTGVEIVGQAIEGFWAEAWADWVKAQTEGRQDK